MIKKQLMVLLIILMGMAGNVPIVHGMESGIESSKEMEIPSSNGESGTVYTDTTNELIVEQSLSPTNEFSDGVESGVAVEPEAIESSVIEEETKTTEDETTGSSILNYEENQWLPESITIERTNETEVFIQEIGEQARKIGQEYGLYSSVMIAQAILESGSGNSQLSQSPYYNLFGVKGAYNGSFVAFPTYEDDGYGSWYQIEAAFKRYPGYEESFQDYAVLLKEGTDWNPFIYQQAWKDSAQSYQEAAKALTGVYATDILYDQKLIALIEAYELMNYDLPESVITDFGRIVSEESVDSDFIQYFGENYDGAEYYAFGNCTQYAYNRVKQLGGYLDVDMGNGMDWGQTGAVRGYEVSHHPAAGTVVSFQPRAAGADAVYGHVAFVEHVYENGSILLSEMNVIGLNVVSYRIIDKVNADTHTYIMPKDFSPNQLSVE
ncbi:glucosaminidase domain-containing protein [Enterococcus sp. LJL128]